MHFGEKQQGEALKPKYLTSEPSDEGQELVGALWKICAGLNHCCPWQGLEMLPWGLDRGKDTLS